MKKFTTIISALALSFAFTAAFAGGEVPPAKNTCSISGTVIDLNSGETLAGVAVFIDGTDKKVYTDLDGNFTLLDVQPGSHDLVFSMISYKNSLVENMEIQAGKEEILEIKLDNN
jgi:hypothetical protein